MWKAAKATYRNAWEKAMKEIKDISEPAFIYLSEINPKHWSKAFFKTDSHCDTLVNNMSESFNSVIVVPRTRPVITMLEDIRVYLMQRWEANRQKISRYEDGVLPNIKKRIARESSFTNIWLVRFDIFLKPFNKLYLYVRFVYFTDFWYIVFILYIRRFYKHDFHFGPFFC